MDNVGLNLKFRSSCSQPASVLTKLQIDKLVETSLSPSKMRLVSYVNDIHIVLNNSIWPTVRITRESPHLHPMV